MIYNFYFYVMILVFAIICVVYGKNALHMFQQNRYELTRYSKWLFNKNNLHFSFVLVYLIIAFIIGSIFDSLSSKILITIISIGYGIYLIITESNKNYIKPLVYTSRIKRFIVFYALVTVAIIYFGLKKLDIRFMPIISSFGMYLLIYVVALITLPLENIIKHHYEDDAKKKLYSYDKLIKIGVTGSYGKTSTKNIINDIISDYKFTLITPSSFNTPMGITRTIREKLKPIHEVFVCEMGADKKNDILYLMNFVKPKYGVVTSIGPQHLNTFKSLDNIINEKMNEIELLPHDGVGFINLDNEYIANYKIKNTCKVVSVGINNKDADYVAKNIKCSKDGTSFSVMINSKNYKFNTSLLGMHNITNILIGIAIGIELGIEIKDIVKAVASINQIEHRLELKKINNFTFIDDAFNANPVGSKMAIDVLSMMKGKRVIVTPGMIDLGKKQDEINFEFGKYMYDKVDFVILVGEKQTESILAGLNEVGFNNKNIKVFKTVKEAFNFIYTNFTSKDTILLENDLPDAFNI